MQKIAVFLSCFGEHEHFLTFRKALCMFDIDFYIRVIFPDTFLDRARDPLLVALRGPC